MKIARGNWNNSRRFILWGCAQGARKNRAYAAKGGLNAIGWPGPSGRVERSETRSSKGSSSGASNTRSAFSPLSCSCCKEHVLRHFNRRFPFGIIQKASMPSTSIQALLGLLVAFGDPARWAGPPRLHSATCTPKSLFVTAFLDYCRPRGYGLQSSLRGGAPERCALCFGLFL